MCSGCIHKVFRVAVSNSSPFLDLMLARQGTLKVALWCEEIRLFRGREFEVENISSLRYIFCARSLSTLSMVSGQKNVNGDALCTNERISSSTIS
jgi:hypothetical protein